jgi:OmpA-OmpF porin, OOP family
MNQGASAEKLVERVQRAGWGLACLGLTVAIAAGCGEERVRVRAVPRPVEPVIVSSPPPPAPPPVVAEVIPEPIKLPAPVKFATGSATLAPESDAVLNVVLDYLKRDLDATKLRVEGHTDNVGNPDANQKLSEARAMSVAQWLIRHGVNCKRLVPIGYGETKPVADNTTDAGRAQNRRTVFIDSERKGRRVGNYTGGHIAGDPCNVR